MAARSAQRIDEARRLLAAGEPRRAERLLRELPADEADDIEARYTLAVALRHQRRFAPSLEQLGQVLAARPGFGRAHQEAGYNHIGLKDFARAEASFERAVAADPGLLNSWKCLARLYRDGDRRERLPEVENRIAYLETLPRELRSAISHMAEGRGERAEDLCKQFLRDNATHVEGMRLLAEILTRNGVHDQAEFLLESCLEFEPGHAQARIQYVNLLLKLQKHARAFDEARKLLDGDGAEQPVVRSLYAAACNGVGRTDEAIEHYRQLIERHPGNHLVPISLGHVYRAQGDIDAAVECYREAARIRREHGDAYWSLANTKSYRFTDVELAQMEAVEADPATGEEDRVNVSFALGKAWEDREEFERSFRYYRRGNALKRARSKHSPEHLDVRIRSQIEVCTEDLFAERGGLGHPGPDPIFIVGLPRSGSTLLEQILSSHPAVDGTMELHEILNLAKRLRGRGGDRPGSPRYPRILAELDDDYFRRFGAQYLELTRAYRGDAPRFIDKMPNNFFHVGLIRLILPNAKVIDARRHPLATGFSGFKQLFGEGQEFSYALAHIGNYYRQYVRLMDHWDRVLPGFVLRVQYEEVVADLEGQVRRLLDFCGLPFEPACLEFHRTERSIRTPSAQQVREPIFTAGLAQWRHYERWLGPLKDALGPELLARYPVETATSPEREARRSGSHGQP